MYTLITAATSAQAYQLKNSLNSADIILGDYLELPAIMLKNANMIKLPNPASASYVHEMLTLCLDKQIKTVYAIRDSELTLLAEAGQLFSEYGIKIMKQTNELMNQ
ncbi:hypothetical protein [Mucilaginibacter sp.]|uniref:hypothetical protein n=1 Tax=Mucilaginibacter sp. TaxID=1882438 RepID=UPI0028468209|nr:hypothetical protein [Mucilaginibacter sp.]MDR3695905.1 hypothetical protein [Mucilaginibacter sp.]